MARSDGCAKASLISELMAQPSCQLAPGYQRIAETEMPRKGILSATRDILKHSAPVGSAVGADAPRVAVEDMHTV
ncbi:hypothetical protein GCM10011363_20600 [Marivita lacus]|uniref:Uncharacterized protein n=1 Tax=Marivita lacus TaxID=1323742 RepID=A0ABQ1KQY8_9RHOB|nr:hypothetical protein GCM10011363_20600 [Marivita lacus]